MIPSKPAAARNQDNPEDESTDHEWAEYNLPLGFLTGYAVVWSVFGALAFLGDALTHDTVDATPWLAAHPAVIGGGVLALGGAFQFSSLKDRCLKECRHPAGFLLPRYQRGTRAAFRLGRQHGLFCLGCCWALMLVGFAAGVANLWWMATLTALMVFEKTGREGQRGCTTWVIASPARSHRLLRSGPRAHAGAGTSGVRRRGVGRSVVKPIASVSAISPSAPP